MAIGQPQCDLCGRFHKCEVGSSYAMRFSGWPLTPDHEATRCKPCTDKDGPLEAQLGVREWTAGVVTCRALSEQEKGE